MAWRRKPHNPIIYKRSQVFLVLVLCVALVVVGLAAWGYISTRNNEVETTVITPDVSEQPQAEVETAEPETPAPVSPLFDTEELQKTLDTWAEGSGQASVVIADVDGTILASHNPDTVYFAASIYKLYVAYAGYQQVDQGVVDPTEVYLNGNTRAECLDLMIRDSDSPCAEKLWVELGKQELTDQLMTYGINNTSMTSISTTAADAATMLGRIARSDELSAQSQASLLTSMQEQIFRDALNKGFSADVTVYNKIGFNDLREYHDTAIVELSDGRRFIVAVLTDSVGTSRIAELGRTIESLIVK